MSSPVTAGGVVLWSYDNGVEATASYTSSPNLAVPTGMTANTGLTSSMSWNSFLGLASESGPNGDTASTGYDSYARPASTTAATGAVTTYAYATAAPWTVTATTNGRWTRTTLDGFGRTVKVEQGNGLTTSTPVSIAETTYEACGCSAVGKTKAVSTPHASGAGSVWRTYVYDALGRTTGVTNPDGSAKSYQYVANTLRVTDEASKWKQYWMDGHGNLTQVQEPDPANPGSASYYTNYTYDFVVEDGEGKPQTRRLPYNDFGIVLFQDVIAGPGQQTADTASYGANRLGFDVGEFVHVNLGKTDEEYVQVLAADLDNQTFDAIAIFTRNHPLGATVRPTIWPTVILNEGDSLAFDTLGVASPDPGSDLTVVIQT